jgi:adenylate cyclase
MARARLRALRSNTSSDRAVLWRSPDWHPPSVDGDRSPNRRLSAPPLLGLCLDTARKLLGLGAPPPYTSLDVRSVERIVKPQDQICCPAHAFLASREVVPPPLPSDSCLPGPLLYRFAGRRRPGASSPALTCLTSHVTLVHVRILQSIRRSIWRLVIGLTVTALVAVLYCYGTLDRWELYALDVRFRRLNDLRFSDLILHVDINDDALQRIHRWPWPRRLHAQLIDTLRELGAREVVMDIVFAEREAPRLILPPVDSAEELADQMPTFSPADAVLDDRELREAIRRAGNVYLAMVFRLAERGGDVARSEEVLLQAVRKDPALSVSELVQRVRSDPRVKDVSEQVLEDVARRVRLSGLLAGQFGLGLDDLARQAGLQRSEVDRILAGLKEQVARKLVHGIAASRPTCDLDRMVDEILPGPVREPLDLRDIHAAYEAEQATRASLARSAIIPADRQQLYPAARSLTPPLAQLAAAARENAFVTFETGSLDGVLRELPLVACYRGRMLRQLAFAAVCDLLEVPAEGVEMAEPGRLVMRGARWPGQTSRRDVSIPLDEQGRFLLNWYSRDGKWEESAKHLAVGRVLEIPQNRAVLAAVRREERDRLRTARARAVHFTCRNTAAAYEDYLRLVQRRDQAERQLDDTPSEDPNRPARSNLVKELDGRIALIEDRAVEGIRTLYGEVVATQPADDEERREFAQIRRIHGDLAARPRTTDSEAEQRLQRRITERIDELRPVVNGKVCFVGYTATAVPDFVTTPVFERCPGVVVHSNLFNTIYSGKFIRRPPRWVGLLLILCCGLLASLITTLRGPIFTLLVASIGLNAAIIPLGLALFRWWQVSIILPSVVLAVLASWALITAYRQLTEEREKRVAFSRLGQYTSPALARRIAEDPGVLRRVDVRDVTCYFSDLKGFTTLSEQFGPERTQAVLNTYLERMSQVLDRYEAFINKFYGDGIFAFFNPAVNPQPDHVRLACEAALCSLVGLEELIAEQREVGDEAFARLHCRIGLATGRVVVGNCGSERKFDYTCIGDTVNLAARLESANKAFGTRIMVADSTRAGVKDLYEWRHLGGLRVVGKRQVVPVYELLGRKGEVPPEQLEYAARFEQGVRLYQEQRWADCVTHFARMLARRPDDLGLMLYMDRCQQVERFGLPEDWIGEIELTEK